MTRGGGRSLFGWHAHAYAATLGKVVDSRAVDLADLVRAAIDPEQKECTREYRQS